MDRPPPQKRSHSSSSSDSESIPFLSQGSSRSIPFIPPLKSLVPDFLFEHKGLKRKKFSDSMTFSSIFPGQHSSLASSVKSFLKSLETGEILPALSVLATEISIAQEPVLLSIPMGKVLEGLKVCLEHPASDVVLMSMNCIITIVEVAPNCSSTIIGLGALPTLIDKVDNPLYIDVAEKSIKIIEKISKIEGVEILNQDLFSIAMEKIDFYENETQKSIVNIGINILKCFTSSNQFRVLNNQGFLSVFNYLQSPISLKVLEFIEIYLEKVENPEAHIYQILDQKFFDSLFEIFFSNNSNKSKVLSIFKSLVKNSPKFISFIFSPTFLQQLKETIEKGSGQEITEVLSVVLSLLEMPSKDTQVFEAVYEEIAKHLFDHASAVFYKLVEINEHPLVVQMFEKLVKVLRPEVLENFVGDPKFGGFLAEALGKKDFLTVSQSISIVNELLNNIPGVCAVMMINEGVFSRLKAFKLIGEVSKLEKPVIKKQLPADPFSFSIFTAVRPEKLTENTKVHNENIRKLVKIVKDILSNSKKFEKTAAQKSAKIQEIVEKIRENSESDFFRLLDLIQGSQSSEDKKSSLKISRYEFTNNDCGAVIWGFLSNHSNPQQVLQKMMSSSTGHGSYLETLFKISLDSFQFLQNLISSSSKVKKASHTVQLEYIRNDENSFRHPVFTDTPTFALNLSQFVTIENLKNSLIGLNSEHDLSFFIESCKITSRISFVEGIHEMIEEGGMKAQNKRTDLEVHLYIKGCLLEPWMTIQDLASINSQSKIFIQFEVTQKPKTATSSELISNLEEACRYIMRACQESGISKFHKLFPYSCILQLCHLCFSSLKEFLPDLNSRSFSFICEKLSASLQAPSPERFLRSFAVRSSFLFSFKSRLKFFASFNYMTRRHHAFKSTVNRKEIIKNAQNILNNVGNDHIEIDFLGEPGIGQGPTLEFFNLLSQEIQTLPVWIQTRSGLFPHPDVDDFRWFHFAGQFVGKVILDKRIADLPINPVFIKQVTGHPVTFKDLQEVDQELFNSLQCLLRLPPESLASLELTFVLPGFKKELVPQGANVGVTGDNFNCYYSRVIQTYLLCPNAADAFRQGFEQFLPIKDLKMFDAAEIQILLSGENSAPWPVEMLAQALLPTHGFTQESRTFKNLLLVLSEFRKSEQEKFVKFVTGSPKLPSGGLLGLNPKMTVVRKEESGDAHLPSVMTCVNYLKIPDYSSYEVLKKNLIYAMEECSCTFYLS